MTNEDGSSLLSWLFGRHQEDRPSHQAHAPRVPVAPPSEPANADESAKRAIDAARALGAQAVGNPGTPFTPSSPPANGAGLTLEETALATDNPVLAIKMVHERTGLTLKEAKALVDTARRGAGA
ncbi:hypothetical protein [Actinomyces sp. W5033]|uniref:hypothetical protein n=1 Tax=Actinomyces sp. W5033 TaxID=3446479 RepID=UPI003EDF367D